FPSSANNVAPLLQPGAVAEHEVIAPFTFPVNKSDQELAREAEELAGTVRPIYEFQQRALDSASIALHAFFAGIENAADQGGGQAVMRVAKEQGLVLSPAEAGYLAKGGKRHGLEKALSDLFDRTLALGVTAPGVLQVEQAPELIIRRRSSETSVSRDQVLSYAQYLARAPRRAGAARHRDQQLGGRRARPAAAGLARGGHLLGPAGVLPAGDVPGATAGGGDRGALRHRPATSRRRRAILPAAPRGHRPAVPRHDDDRAVQRPRFDE